MGPQAKPEHHVSRNLNHESQDLNHLEDDTADSEPNMEHSSRSKRRRHRKHKRRPRRKHRKQRKHRKHRKHHPKPSNYDPDSADHSPKSLSHISRKLITPIADDNSPSQSENNAHDVPDSENSGDAKVRSMFHHQYNQRQFINRPQFMRNSRRMSHMEPQYSRFGQGSSYDRDDYVLSKYFKNVPDLHLIVPMKEFWNYILLRKHYAC